MYLLTFPLIIIIVRLDFLPLLPFCLSSLAFSPTYEVLGMKASISCVLGKGSIAEPMFTATDWGLWVEAIAMSHTPSSLLGDSKQVLYC